MKKRLIYGRGQYFYNKYGHTEYPFKIIDKNGVRQYRHISVGFEGNRRDAIKKLKRQGRKYDRHFGAWSAPVDLAAQKKVMLRNFDEWGSANMNGYGKGGVKLLRQLERSKVSVESDGVYQINMTGYTQKYLRQARKWHKKQLMKEGDVKIRYDSNRGEFTYYLRGRDYS